MLRLTPFRPILRPKNQSLSRQLRRTKTLTNHIQVLRISSFYIEPFSRHVPAAYEPRGTETLKKIEMELKLQEDRYTKLLAEYNEQFESTAFDKKCTYYMYLRSENKQIREELKRLHTIGELHK